MVGDLTPRESASTIEGGTVGDGGVDGNCRGELEEFGDGRDGEGLMVRTSVGRVGGELVLVLELVA
jgi:hypothetical protein